MDLTRRDAGAIAYTKSQLVDGDTLVFINYPPGVTAYDGTGFPLATKLRVHSQRLLATGSSKFTKMFEPIQQARFRRAKQLRLETDLPYGVQFVLDLTPPNEGDEAVEQISNLSCPKGIIYWSTAVDRLGVDRSVIGGKDEYAVLIGENISHSHAFDNTTRPEGSDVPDNRPRGDSKMEKELPERIGRSVEEALDNGQVFPKEYCAIRHRAAIERLLQIIEGKDPRLDSATKVWSLSMVAKFFECESVVVDAVSSWCLSQKNSAIIEILPEAILRLGLALESQILTRGAYSVLVSEEALHLAGMDKSEPAVPSNSAPKTLFGRVRDSIDEDTLNIIQHAGQSFLSRIDLTVRNLIGADMAWIKELPEYGKLNGLFQFTYVNSDKSMLGSESARNTIEELTEKISNFVRGRIFYMLLQQPFDDQVAAANSNRRMEHYMLSPPDSFRELYDHLRSEERVITRTFWSMIRSSPLAPLRAETNLIFEKLPIASPYSHENMNLKVAEHFGIQRVSTHQLFILTDKFNQSVINSISNNGYQGGIMPPEAFGTQDAPSESASSPRSTEWKETYDDFGLPTNGKEATSSLDSFISRSNSRPTPPLFQYIPLTSPFFNLPRLFTQIGKHVNDIADTMTSFGENPGFTLPQTLLCLTDEEYKYLPLWAGGLDDGTSGVYQDSLPPAIAGPSGPGPAYHTGFSSASAPSSEYSFSDDSEFGASASTIGNWSRAVENGHSDHINRHEVQSEVSFGTVGFSDLALHKREKIKAESESSFGTLDFEDAGYVGKGKEKEVEDVNMKDVPEAFSRPRTTIDTIMDDNFFCDEEEEDINFDDSGDETETEESYVKV